MTPGGSLRSLTAKSRQRLVCCGKLAALLSPRKRTLVAAFEMTADVRSLLLPFRGQICGYREFA